jgi:hypothetical protein
MPAQLQQILNILSEGYPDVIIYFGQGVSLVGGALIIRENLVWGIPTVVGGYICQGVGEVLKNEGPANTIIELTVTAVVPEPARPFMDILKPFGFWIFSR